MHFEVFSLFPQYIEGPIQQSILKRAINNGQIRVTCEDIRSYSREPRKRVDDTSYGGGPGMVLMVDPIAQGIEQKRGPKTKVLYLSPQGRRLTPTLAKELALESHLILLSGHYEGIDARAVDSLVDMEVSIGDFILTNGSLAALVLIDVVARYIPGVIGNEKAALQDSFESHLLDFPHYTRPEIYDSQPVPKVLLSGNHEAIDSWRYGKSLEATWEKRPDLFSQAVLFQKEELKASIGGKSGPSLKQLSFPVTSFSASLQFYSKLFEKDPICETNGKLERATWIIGESSFLFTLYATPFEKQSMPVGFLFEYLLEEDSCISFLLWVSQKMKSCIGCFESEKEIKSSIKAHIEEKKSITLLDPSGYRISLQSV